MSKHLPKKTIIIQDKPVKRASILMKRVPIYILILLFLPLFSLGYFMHHPQNQSKTPSSQATNNVSPDDACAIIIRQNDSSLIRPLLLVEINDEQNLIPAKKKIINYIEQKKQQGILTTASVYLNDLNTANHIEVNPSELYDPASIMKVSMLITYLKQAESNPALLKKKYTFTESAGKSVFANIKDKSLIKGQSYYVEDLLYYMIVYSDNDAFLLLAKNADKHNFNLLNDDIKIPLLTDKKDLQQQKANFIANVNSVSRFFRILYSATYLNHKMSVYALDILTRSTYKEGIIKGIDPSVKVAHKFGERVQDGAAELHEFGIVYLKNRPYLIGVMTKGKNLNQLPEIISDISKIVFDEMRTK